MMDTAVLPPCAGLIREIIDSHPSPSGTMLHYINDLLRLEEFIRDDGPHSFRDGIEFYFLKTRYEKEYAELLGEILPQFLRKVGASAGPLSPKAAQKL